MSRRVAQALMLTVLAALFGLGAAQAMPSPAPQGGSFEPVQTTPLYCASPAASALVDLINGYRAERGLPALVLAVPLGAAAQHHAESMATYNYFDFTLVPESASYDQNIRMYGYTGSYLGANIAAGPGSITAATVFEQWLSSPSQNANLLNPLFNAIGLGTASNPDSSFINYWAAAFGDDANVEIAAPCDLQTSTPTPAETPGAATPTAEPVLTETATSAPIASPVPETTVVAGVACASDREVARAGQAVTVTCAGFDPNDEIEIYWDQPLASARLDSAISDADGNAGFVITALEVPSRRYILIARSITTRLTATTPIEMRPGLFLLPRSGDPGDVINADLTGFQPGEAVTIMWFDDATTTRVVRQITVGEDGSWTTTFRAPASEPGAHTLEARGIGGGRATASFEIEADE